MPWSLNDDSTGDVIDTGTEAEMKARYHAAIRSGEVAEMNAFIEDDAGDRQYAWNRHRQCWDEL
jgi:hypothetical protein